MKLFAKKPMNSPLRAMTWEFRLDYDSKIDPSNLIFTVFCVSLVMMFPDIPDHRSYDLTRMVFMGSFIAGIILFALNDDLKFISSRNRWKYVLPISTSKSVLFQFLIIGGYLVLLYIFFWAGLSIWYLRIFPLCLPILCLMTILFCRFMVVRVASVSLTASLILGLISFTGCLYLQNPLIQNVIPFIALPKNNFEWYYILIALGLIGLSVSTTIWATALDRQGIRSKSINLSFYKIHIPFVPRIKKFPSPFWAFAWFDFIKYGLWIPLAGVILACFGHQVSYYALFPYPIIAPITGLLIMGRMNSKATDPCIDSFRGCLPASERDFISAKTLVIMGSVLLGAIPLIAMAYTELTRWDYRLNGIILYFVSASLGGWILFAQLFTLFLRSGNENQWLYREPIFYIFILCFFCFSDFSLMIMGFFICLYIAGNTYLIITEAQRYGLVSRSVTYWAGVIWFALTLLAYWVFYLTERKWVSPFILTPGLLLLAVTPVAALPLAMWHNRHR